jgi:hypothetical protein
LAAFLASEGVNVAESAINLTVTGAISSHLPPIKVEYTINTFDSIVMEKLKLVTPARLLEVLQDKGLTRVKHIVQGQRKQVSTLQFSVVSFVMFLITGCIPLLLPKWNIRRLTVVDGLLPLHAHL